MRRRKTLNEKIVSLQKRLSVYNSRCEIKNKRFQNNKYQVTKYDKLRTEFFKEVIDLWSQQIAEICDKSILQKMEKEYNL